MNYTATKISRQSSLYKIRYSFVRLGFFFFKKKKNSHFVCIKCVLSFQVIVGNHFGRYRVIRCRWIDCFIRTGSRLGPDVDQRRVHSSVQIFK